MNGEGQGGGPESEQPTGTPPVEPTDTGSKAAEGHPSIPPKDREVLERYLGPLPDEVTEGEAKEETSDRPAGARERTDIYGRPVVDPMTAPWETVESYSPIPDRPGDKPGDPGYKAVRIFDQMQHQMWVYWPKDKGEARKRTRDLLSRIELEKGSLGQQISTEYTRITSILGSLKGEEITKETPEEEQAIYEDAKKLQEEVEARMIFREISLQYENSSDLNVVVKAAQEKLQPEHFNAIFGITQTYLKDGKETEFNPFIQALQYYEDHGEEFAVFSSLEDRPLFAAKVQRDLVKRFGGKPANYAAAQLLAERMFRFTCRAVMFDSLVDKGLIDEGTKKTKWSIYKNGVIEKYKAYKKAAEDAERDGKVSPDLPEFTPIPKELRITEEYYTGEKLNATKYYAPGHEGEKGYEREIKFDWIGAGDGCDYDTRRTTRQRDLVIKEQVTLHAHVQLLENVDCYGGDFFTRAEGVASQFRKEDKFIVYGKIKERGMKWLDREDHNTGGKVGRINFTKLDGLVGFDFNSMGRGLMGLWASRNVAGAEGVRDALTKTSECFLRNPNTESLRKLMDAFAFSKKNSDEAKKASVLNFIKFIKTEREEKTGKPKYNREGIIAIVNDLSGVTDPNKPPFIDYSFRKEVLAKVFGHPFTDLITKGIVARDFILGFFWGILKSIFGQGFSNFGK